MSSSRSSKRRSEGASKSRSQSSSASVSDEENNSDVEEIDNDSDDGSGSEFSKIPKKSRVSYTNTAAFTMPDDIKKLTERILCCSCGKQLNYMNPGAIRKHPWLKVVTCKKCYKFLKSGSFTRDDDGIDEQCRWCGDGGRLYGCDYCNHCFCRSCIKRNLGRSEASKMEDEADRKWHCYLCKPKKIGKLTDDCKKILAYIEMEEQKEKAKEERAKKREKDKETQYKKDREEKLKARRERDGKKDSGKLTVKTEVKSEVKDEKTTPKRSFPAPKDKEKLNVSVKAETKPVSVKAETKHDTPAKVDAPPKVNGNHTADVIVVESSPDKSVRDKVPHFKHHRANLYQPNKDGVQRVVKDQNVLHVTVGPQKPVIVAAPYKDKMFVPTVTQSTGNMMIVPGFSGKSQLTNMLQAPRRIVSSVISNSVTTAKLNDIWHMKNAVTIGNVDGMLERLQHTSKAFSLQMEAIKTDLQIARLSQANMNFARGSAVSSLKSSVDVMFNNFRDMFNVQLVANQPGNAAEAEKGVESSVKSEVKNTEASAIVLDDDGASDKNTGDKGDSNIVDISDSDSVKEVTEKSDKEQKEITANSKEDFVVEVNEDYDKMEVDEEATDDKSDKTPTKEASEESESKNIDKEEETIDAESVKSPKGSSKKKEDENMEIEEEINDSETDKSNASIEKNSDESKEVSDSKKGKTSKKEEIKESKIIDSDKEESKSKDSLKKGENTAAELERLKEMADDIREGIEDTEEDKQTPRKSTRTRKSDKSETENSVAEKELLKEMEEELDEESENDVKKHRKSARGKKSDKNETESSATEHESLKEMEEEPEEAFEESENDSKGRRRSARSKKQDDKSETENSVAEKELLKEMEEELNEESENDVKKNRKSGKSKKSDKNETENSAAEQELLKEMEDELDEDDSKERRRSARSKKQEDKNETENSAAERELLKEMEEELDEESGDDVKSSRRSTRTKKQEEKSETKESSKKSGSPKKKEKDENTDSKRRSSRAKPDKDSQEEESDDTVDDKKSSKSKSADLKKEESSAKRDGKKDAKTKESSKHEKSDDSKNKETKSAKKSDKSPKDKKKKNVSDDDSDDTEVEGVKDLPDTLSSGDTSSDNDSDASDSETGRRSRRSKQKKRKDLDSSKRETRSRQSKRGKKKAEKGSEDDDSDPEFDRDLEKEIESLSKETRLTRARKKDGGKSAATSSKNDSKKYESKSDKKKLLLVSDSESNSDMEDDDVGRPPDEDQDDEDDDDTDVSEQLSPSQIRKLKQAQKKADEEESDDDEENIIDSDMSSDPEVSFPKLTSPKKTGKGGRKNKLEIEELSDDSDFIAPKKKKKKGFKNELLSAKISDSDDDDSEDSYGGKKKKGKAKGKGKRKKGADSDDSDDDSEGGKKKGKGKKRRRIKRMDSSEEEKEPGADDRIDDEGDSDDDENTPGGYLKRRKIRKVQGKKKLAEETKAAQKAEEDRRKRIEERQKEYNSYVEVEGGGEEDADVPEGTVTEKVDKPDEPTAIAKIIGSPKKIPITTKCILEIDKETKEPLIEIDRTLVRKLKPHQVAAVRFMYNCCVESIACLRKGGGAGAILAHCMGLGKTLSVITFIHTLLRNVKHTKMTKCLVVCPLNTCLNWVNEFEIWLDDVDFEIDVYEMSRVKQNFERAQMLKEWHEGDAGVMILGYDMYRNLVQGSHCKNKKQKKIFYETLAEPGPDLVVCDEGHILKNDQTSLSKSMNKIKSQRRIVLTGTPLQNNMGEYHCMVSFVKPSLLGTRKEFNNRFANPITNGQCSDSSPMDVKVMKRRAHILHEMLAGCVQRKDYSALTKYLPPKFEYVVSVRLSKVQMQLYEKYLELSGITGNDMQGSKGARLFKDYQALMRIWTHPWVMKLDEIRQENKRQYDDSEDSFVDDEDTDEMDSFIDDTTSSNSDSDKTSGSDDDKKKSKKKKGKKKRKKDASSSSDDDKKKEDNDEVVKKWTSKRRGNEEGAGSSWMEDMGYAAGPRELTTEWWAEYVKEEDEHKLELSGKLTLLFEILKLCEDIGDKVLVFSQSLLSLDIIEDFLAKIDAANQPEVPGEGDGANKDPATKDPATDKPATDKPAVNGDTEKMDVAAGGSGEGAEGGSGEKEEKELTPEEKIAKEVKERLSQFGKCWTKGADYFRMDGSTSSQHRKSSQDMFNDPENFRARLFLISTKAGSLGINLVAANRVIIFDASWNPSHDIQSIFRVYRFGQIKPVYVYRFLAQGTMEEKIYERQVTKQSLSQRVVDEHQIERHFTSSDLAELYRFTPDRLDDPNKKARPLPMLPKDHMLAELMTTYKDQIVTFHEHDSLLENVVSQELNEDEKKAAWEDYENEKKGLVNNMRFMGGMPNQGQFANQQFMATQQMNMQNLLLQGQASLGQPAVLQIVQDLKARFPNLPPEVFQQRVQAVLRQVITNQIMQQSDIQRRQVEQQRMNELNRLNQLKAQIQRQQQMMGGQAGGFNVGAGRGLPANANFSNLGAVGLSGGLQTSGSMPNLQRHLMGLKADQNAQARKTNTPPPKPK